MEVGCTHITLQAYTCFSPAFRVPNWGRKDPIQLKIQLSSVCISALRAHLGLQVGDIRRLGSARLDLRLPRGELLDEALPQSVVGGLVLQLLAGAAGSGQVPSLQTPGASEACCHRNPRIASSAVERLVLQLLACTSCSGQVPSLQTSSVSELC